jgi:hypothetical protein
MTLDKTYIPKHITYIFEALHVKCTVNIAEALSIALLRPREVTRAAQNSLLPSLDLIPAI